MAAPGNWQLSDSSSESDSDSGHAAAPASVRRPAHRPRKYPVGLTRTEIRRLKAAREAEAQSGVGEPSSIVVRPEPEAQQQSRISLLRPVGGGEIEFIGKLMNLPDRDRRVTHEQKEESKKLIERFVPTMPHFCRHRRRIPSAAGVARELAIPPRTVQRRLLMTGAAVFYGSLCLVGGIISRITNLERDKKLKVEAVFTFTSYDETPMRVRARAKQEGPVDGKAVTSKLLQSELDVGILTSSGGRFSLTLVTLPCPVHIFSNGVWVRP